MTSLAIIIVSYNTRADLDACLRSLAAAPPRIPHDVVVVDNGSTDGSPDLIRGTWPQVRLIEAGGNLGFSRANNLGIRATRSDLLLLLNSDTLVPAGAIDTLIDGLRQHPGTAIVGPRLVDASGRAELSFGPMLSPLAEWRQKRLVRGNDAGVPAIVATVDAMTRREQPVDWVSGACLLVRRADAEAAGLLDERFFMYTEDVDFCAAVRALGREVRFLPQSQVTHLRGRSARTAPGATSLAYRRSHLAFYDKHHPVLARLLRVYLRLKGQHPG